LVVVISSKTYPLCKGANTGTAASAVSGGTVPYTYLWSNAGSSTTASVSALSAGTYTVNVHDAHYCTASVSVTITQPAATIVAAINTHTNVLCNGGTSWTATASATGG